MFLQKALKTSEKPLHVRHPAQAHPKAIFQWGSHRPHQYALLFEGIDCCWGSSLGFQQKKIGFSRIELHALFPQKTLQLRLDLLHQMLN